MQIKMKLANLGHAQRLVSEVVNIFCNFLFGYFSVLKIIMMDF